MTDFGLAKRGLGSDLTHTTDVLGTPAYMAPEQASGRTKFVGPEADVWALGVMLYELLCGQRPFEAPTPLEVMAAVAKAEVPKLRDRFPTVPTDLALVAHKCLSADPRDRYPTAGALAVDLRNWLDGKPVSARPAGVIESAVRWVKRNKRVALTGLAVLLVMATATGVSLGFGLDATEQRKKAEEEKQAAVEARNDLAKANEKTERALARAKVERAQNLSAMLDTRDFHWELVNGRDQRFGLTFLEEATTTDIPNDRGTSLNSELMHSIVGLDSDRRRRVQAMLSDRQQDPSLSARMRGIVTWIILREDLRGVVDDQLADRIVSAFATNVDYYWEWRTESALMCARRMPHRAEQMVGLLTDQIRTTKDAYDVRLGTAAVAQACRLLPSERAEQTAQVVSEVLLTTLEKTREFWEPYELVLALRAIYPLLPASQSRRLADLASDKLAQAVIEDKDINGRAMTSKSLNDLCELLPEQRARDVARQLIPRLLSDIESRATALWESDPAAVRDLSRWLPAGERTAVITKLVRLVCASIDKAANDYEFESIISALGETCLGLPPDQAEAILATELGKRTQPVAQRGRNTARARCGNPPSTREESIEFAGWLAEVVVYERFNLQRDVPHALEALCLGLTREELHRRKAFPAVAGGLVPPDNLPKPKPLPPQVLVDLLKRPFVVREKRRAVLNALEFTYDRKFKDLWEFVAFAEKEHPELDLLTPPKRPEKK